MDEQAPKRAGRRLVFTLLGIIAILLVYAFAVQATEIDLKKPLDPGRQEDLLRVLRALADPDIVTIDEDTGDRILSETTKITFEAIIETILMALLASTAGTFLAVPVSFLAARNLMENITAPLASIMAGIIAATVVGATMLLATGFLVGLSDSLVENITYGIVALVVTAGLFWLAAAKSSKFVDSLAEGEAGHGVLQLIRLALIVGLLLFALALVGQLGVVVGEWLAENIGPFGFLGNFIFVLSDMLRLLLPVIAALVAGVVAASNGSRYAQDAVIKWPVLPARILTGLVSVVGTFIVIFAIGSVLNWLYAFDQPERWTTIPALIGGVIMGLFGLSIKPSRPFGIGSVIYTISRSILNILRSIEPLIMGIVFVVWVALGPFAGIMALTLHSIAALGKLFSEQIEGIDEGPVEAITATGANSLQRIFFAVIPQIVPPFTAFALYRWDINVRMSTIIGFVGGGGIGYILTQNIRLLRYRQAAVMMLAIAIVVATLDYASSKIRSRII
ncbi:MAG: ABC transporter permease subunit [Candidatus Promineifilaceae bacterium]